MDWSILIFAVITFQSHSSPDISYDNKPLYIIVLYPIGRPVRATITLYPIGRPVRATITLYPIGIPVRATITQYPVTLAKALM